MSTFPNSPRLLKGGIASRNPQAAAVRRIISSQHNPDISAATAKEIIAITCKGDGR